MKRTYCNRVKKDVLVPSAIWIRFQEVSPEDSINHRCTLSGISSPESWSGCQLKGPTGVHPRKFNWSMWKSQSCACNITCVLSASFRPFWVPPFVVFGDTVTNDERCKYVAIYCLNLFPYMYVCMSLNDNIAVVASNCHCCCSTFSLNFMMNIFLSLQFFGWDSPNISFPVWVWVCNTNFMCKHPQAPKKRT